MKHIISSETLLNAIKASDYLMGEYFNFVYAASTPKYFSQEVTLEQAALRTVRNVLGVYAEPTEYYDTSGDCVECVRDEMGDVLFWFINIVGAGLCNTKEYEALDMTDIADALEKWSRSPETKSTKLSLIHSDILDVTVLALNDYFNTVECYPNGQQELTKLLEGIAKQNYAKLTKQPRI